MLRRRALALLHAALVPHAAPSPKLSLGAALRLRADYVASGSRGEGAAADVGGGAPPGLSGGGNGSGQLAHESSARDEAPNKVISVKSAAATTAQPLVGGAGAAVSGGSSAGAAAAIAPRSMGSSAAPAPNSKEHNLTVTMTTQQQQAHEPTGSPQPPPLQQLQPPPVPPATAAASSALPVDPPLLRERLLACRSAGRLLQELDLAVAAASLAASAGAAPRRIGGSSTGTSVASASASTPTRGPAGAALAVLLPPDAARAVLLHLASLPRPSPHELNQWPSPHTADARRRAMRPYHRHRQAVAALFQLLQPGYAASQPGQLVELLECATRLGWLLGPCGRVTPPPPPRLRPPPPPPQVADGGAEGAGGGSATELPAVGLGAENVAETGSPGSAAASLLTAAAPPPPAARTAVHPAVPLLSALTADRCAALLQWPQEPGPALAPQPPSLPARLLDCLGRLGLKLRAHPPPPRSRTSSSSPSPSASAVTTTTSASSVPDPQLHRLLADVMPPLLAARQDLPPQDLIRLVAAAAELRPAADPYLAPCWDELCGRLAAGSAAGRLGGGGAGAGAGGAGRALGQLSCEELVRLAAALADLRREDAQRAEEAEATARGRDQGSRSREEGGSSVRGVQDGDVGYLDDEGDDADADGWGEGPAARVQQQQMQQRRQQQRDHMSDRIGGSRTVGGLSHGSSALEGGAEDMLAASGEDRLLAALSHEAAERAAAGRLSGGAAAELLVAAAGLGWRGDAALLAALTAAARRDVRSLVSQRPDQLSQLLVACAKLGHADEQLLTSVGAALAAELRLPRLSPAASEAAGTAAAPESSISISGGGGGGSYPLRSLAVSVWAAACLGRPCPGLFGPEVAAALAAGMRSQLDSEAGDDVASEDGAVAGAGPIQTQHQQQEQQALRPHEVGNVMWAFARQGVPRPELAAAATQAALRWQQLGQLPRRCLIKILAAAAAMGHVPSAPSGTAAAAAAAAVTSRPGSGGSASASGRGKEQAAGGGHEEGSEQRALLALARRLAKAVAEGAERLPPAELAAAAEALVPYCAPGAALHDEYGSAVLRSLVAAARQHVADLRPDACVSLLCALSRLAPAGSPSALTSVLDPRLLSRLQQRLAPSVAAGRLSAPQLSALVQALAELGARAAPLLPALEQQLLRQIAAEGSGGDGSSGDGGGSVTGGSGGGSGLGGGQVVATLLALGQLQRRGAVSELFRLTSSKLAAELDQQASSGGSGGGGGVSAGDLSKLLRLLGGAVEARLREQQLQYKARRRAARANKPGPAEHFVSERDAAASANIVLGPGRKAFLDAAWSALSEQRRTATAATRKRGGGAAAGSSPAPSGGSSGSSSGSSSRRRRLEELTPTQLVDVVAGLAACRYDNTEAYDTLCTRLHGRVKHLAGWSLSRLAAALHTAPRPPPGHPPAPPPPSSAPTVAAVVSDDELEEGEQGKPPGSPSQRTAKSRSSRASGAAVTAASAADSTEPMQGAASLGQAAAGTQLSRHPEMLERIAKYGTKEVAAAGSSFRPEAVAQLAGVFAAEPYGPQYGGLFLAAAHTARRWLLQLRERAGEEAARGGGRRRARERERQRQGADMHEEEEEDGEGGDQGESAAARELRLAAVRVAAACEEAGYSVDEVLEPELLQPPPSPSSRGGRGSRGSGRDRAGASDIRSRSSSRAGGGWPDEDGFDEAAGGPAYGSKAPGGGRRAAAAGVGSGGGRRAAGPAGRGRARRFEDDDWSDEEMEAEERGDSKGRRMQGARGAGRQKGYEVRWSGPEPRAPRGTGRGNTGGDRSSRDAAHAPHPRIAHRASATAAPAVTVSSDLHVPSLRHHPAAPATPPAPAPGPAELSSLPTTSLPTTPWVPMPVSLPLPTTNGAPTASPQPPQAPLLTPDSTSLASSSSSSSSCCRRRPPPRLLGFSDELYDSLLRPAVEAAEAQWVAGGDASLFRRHRSLQLEARRQERHQQLRARERAQLQGRGQQEQRQRAQATPQAAGGTDQGQQLDQSEPPAVGMEQQQQQQSTHHLRHHHHHQRGAAGPQRPLLQDGHHHFHIPAESSNARQGGATPSAQGGSAGTPPGGSSAARADMQAAGPPVSVQASAAPSPASAPAATATATSASRSEARHQHQQLQEHNHQTRQHQHQHQQHQQQQQQQQQQPHGPGGELLQKLRLVLSYQYDMPLEDVRPDLDLGQLRRPAGVAAAAAAATAAAGATGAAAAAGAANPDDETRQQVVVDCVEGAFEVFLQLGGDWAALTVAQLAAAIRGRLEQEWG
ncbi:hypothetical protein HYH02_004704 [Chlamydomonas schloesseri]|uniref:Uncharacterized protein n=1 Tax=Chlamydomonas schloesseri TaxID=2026947 RepID=A0A835WQ14_9CHLO|nr:hypothetical protein HYH02_004704 [Chlamydomonas schloesseri]|eukprot:KAG2450871.1 hypothetical protein HYH02_004704 [Chlamydomonas schloesseri]